MGDMLVLTFLEGKQVVLWLEENLLPFIALIVTCSVGVTDSHPDTTHITSKKATPSLTPDCIVSRFTNPQNPLQKNTPSPPQRLPI